MRLFIKPRFEKAFVLSLWLVFSPCLAQKNIIEAPLCINKKSCKTVFFENPFLDRKSSAVSSTKLKQKYWVVPKQSIPGAATDVAFKDFIVDPASLSDLPGNVDVESVWVTDQVYAFQLTHIYMY